MKKVIFYPSALPWRQPFAILLFLMLFRVHSFGQGPSVFCTPHQTQFLSGTTSTLPFWASDFFEFGISPNGFNNNSVRLRITNQLGTIVAGGTSGYPTPPPPSGYQLTCNNGGAGVYIVEVWGQDSLGNADYCTTTLVVSDNVNSCMADSSIYTGTIKYYATQALMPQVTVTISGNSNVVGPFSTSELTNGTYTFLNSVPSATNVVITPSKVLVPPSTLGLSAFDIILIQKHILGLTPLNGPFAILAADVNGSKTVTGADITEIRKFIQGVTTQLPGNRQYGFTPTTFVFPNPNNPFWVSIPSTITIPVMNGNMISLDFIGFKYGDVSGDALLTNDVVEDRNLPIAYIQADDRHVQAGEVFEVKFQTAEAFTAYQFTMDLQGLEVAEIMPGEGMTSDDFALLNASKTVTAVVANETARAFSIRFKASRSGKLSEMIQATHNVTPSLAYDEKGKDSEIAFRFRAATAHTLELYPSTPNPFMEATNIRFDLQEATKVTLRVHDAYGRILHTQTAQYTEGQHSIAFTSEQVKASGVLYYTLETEKDKLVGQMVKLK